MCDLQHPVIISTVKCLENTSVPRFSGNGESVLRVIAIAESCARIRPRGDSVRIADMTRLASLRHHNVDVITHS